MNFKIYTAGIFLLIVILFISCDHQNTTKVPPATAKTDETTLRDTIINHADTITNKPIGKGFYKNDKGDIFELKRTGYGLKSSTGVWTAYIILDDEIIDSAFDNRGQLKEYIDIATYVDDSPSNYSKDKEHVYWERASSDGPIRFVVFNADAQSFTGIMEQWGKDARHVFFGGDIVKNADPRTFVYVKGSWGKDKRFVFYEDKIVKNADPKTFYVYENSYDTASDKKHMYVDGEIIK